MSERIQWEVNRDNKCISEQDTEEVVLYYDQIPVETVVYVVNAWNGGESIEAIGKELDRMDDVTLDQVDYIVDQIKLYIQVSAKEHATDSAIESAGMKDMFKTKEEWDKMAAEANEGPMTVTEVEETLTNIVNNTMETTVEGPITGNAGMKTAEGEVLVKAPEKTKPATKRTQVQTVKKVDANSVIESLKAQAEKANRLIGCIGYINTTVQLTDLPPDLEKAERDNLLGYCKEIEAIQNKYLQIIQKL